MITDFKLTGLTRPNILVCEFKSEETFKLKSSLTLDKFNELWEYCKHNWSEIKIIEIEHDGFLTCGRPKDPVMLGIKLE